jgi:3',5'-cyclic AMP phosphodiesterase CpdA
MNNRTLHAILALFIACTTVPADLSAAEKGNFTFFFISDTHLGANNPKSTPPVTAEQIESKVRGVVSNMQAIAQKPFSKRGPFKDIEMGPAGPVKGILIAGDITDHGSAEEFETLDKVFPRAGIQFGTGLAPVYANIGNHDGRHVKGDVRLGMIERNRANLKAGIVSSVSENGVQYAFNLGGIHVVSVGLYPADSPDAQMPFKFGGGGVGQGNDPQGALTFLTNYLHTVVGRSGKPVIIMHHFGFDPFSTNDWNWWTPALRRAYYDAIRNFNILAIFHGHDHAARHYYWPDQKSNPDEVKKLFGEKPPADMKSFDIFSAGSVCWVFRVQGDKLLAMHHAAKEWTTSPDKIVVKPLMPAAR